MKKINKKEKFYKNKLQEVLCHRIHNIIFTQCQELSMANEEIVEYVKIEEDEDLKILKIEIGINIKISKETKNAVEDYLRFLFFCDITEKTKITWVKI